MARDRGAEGAEAERPVSCPPCSRCGWPEPDVFEFRGRPLCVVCMGLEPDPIGPISGGDQ